MSLLKGPISLTWTRTTLDKLKREWPRSGMSKNQYTEQMHIKGTRYDALEDENKRLKREIEKLKGKG